MSFTHQAVSAQLSKPSWLRTVPDTPDLQRILRIPRREWTPAEAQELAVQMTELLRVPGGKMSLRPFQAVALHDLAAYGGLVGMGRVGIGKSSVSSHKVLTPEGYRLMGELQVGDEVIGSNGEATEVLGVFPQGKLPVFRVHFSDGTFADVSEDHLWQVEWRRRTSEKNFAVLTTKQLRERPIHEYLDSWGRPVRTDLSKKRLHIPMLSAPVEFYGQESNLPVEPYDLGALIANGALSGTYAVLTVRDDDFFEVLSQLDWEATNIREGSGCYHAAFLTRHHSAIRELELNVKSREKFIPTQYLRADVPSRVRLFQGLMDCDGSCSLVGNKLTYHTSSKQLAEDVRELVELLGGQVRTNFIDREESGHGVEYRLQIKVPSWLKPFTVTRKASRYNPSFQANPSRSVTHVEDLKREEECVCIKVSAENSLFALDHGVLTHNTLISFLAPYVVEAFRPLLVIPANLRRKTERDVFEYKSHWEVSSMMAVESYQKMARKSYAYYLEVTKPDLLVFDEAHHLKNTKAAVTRRVKRYLEACEQDRLTSLKEGTPRKYPDPKIALLSGTFTNRSLREYWHLLKWALPRENVPLPLELAQLDLWCCAIDEKVKEGNRIKVGALSQMFNAEEKKLAEAGSDVSAARRAYGRRLVQTPGIVATTETFSGSTLSVTDIRLELPTLVREAFQLLRTEWELPEGETLADGTMMAKAAKELALGFYYVWDPSPPKEWAEARREWFQQVRRILSHNKRGLDTEEQVKEAVLQGLYPHDKLASWLQIKDIFKPNVKAIWIDDFAVDAAADWAKKNKGIVWVFHTAFGQKLAAKTKLAFYGEGGFSADGKFIEDHPKGYPMIASLSANKEGKNLQNWSKNLVCHPPSSGGWWEQMIGRTHRDGQQAAHVSFEMFGSCIEHYLAFEKALGDAMYVQDSTPMVQKLLYADVDVPSVDDVSDFSGPEWRKVARPETKLSLVVGGR